MARDARGRLRRLGDPVPDRVTAQMSAALSAVRARTAGRAPSSPSSPLAASSDAAGAAAEDPEPGSPMQVRIDRQRILAPRRDGRAASPISRR